MTTHDLTPIRQLIHADLSALDQAIRTHLSSDIPFIDQLCHYIIDSGGKRLRPLVSLLAAKACGYQGDKHVDLACAIEFFHTATLLHDDVVDASQLRRGQQTANDIWGSKASILVGDFLFTRAMQLLVASGNPDVVALMSNTSNTISKGEILQLLNCKNPDISLDDYHRVTFCKTAVLFATSSEFGALLCHVDAPLQQALQRYGEQLGHAFQIVDDALDYCSDSDTLGKNIGDDLAEGKPTLPLIIAMQRTRDDEKAFIQQVIRLGELDKLDRLMEIIHHTKALDECFAMATKRSEEAKQALAILPDSAYKNALLNIADFSVARQY